MMNSQAFNIESETFGEYDKPYLSRPKTIFPCIRNREYFTHPVSHDISMRRLKRAFQCSEWNDLDLTFFQSPVFVSHFCPLPMHGSLLAAANEMGKLMLWNMTPRTYKGLFAVNVCHDNAIFDLAWATRDLRIATASGDKSVAVWDCRLDCSLVQVNSLRGHAATVKCVKWDPESINILASGDRKGMVLIWDYRTNKPENKIVCAHERTRFWKLGKEPIDEPTSVTGMAFHNPYHLVTSGAGAPLIRMWDLRKFYTVHTKKVQPIREFKHPDFEDKSGYSCLIMDPGKNLLYATTVHDRIYSFNFNDPELKPVATFTGGVLRSFYIKSCLSSDGKYLISGSSSEYCLLWNTSEVNGREVYPLRKMGTLSTELEVNTVAWCKSPSDYFKIAVFPENLPGEVFDLNPLCIDPEFWDAPPFEAENNDALERDVSHVEILLGDKHDNKKYICVKTVTNKQSSVLSRQSRHEQACRGRCKQTRLGLISCASQSNKRAIQEMLGKDSEDRQNKKMKLRSKLSPRRLFVGSDNPDADENDSVSSQSVNFRDVNETDSLNGDNTSQLGPRISDEDDKGNVDCTSVADTSVKTPFSPTSNLPNHVIDGTSPSHVCRPSRKKRSDWLTELRHGRVSNLEVNNKEVDYSRKTELVKKQPKKQNESILKFFRVLQNDDSN